MQEFIDFAKRAREKDAVVSFSWDKAITKPDGSVTICYKLMPKQWKAIKYDQDNRVLIVAVTGIAIEAKVRTLT